MAINKEDYLYISSLLRAREPRMLSRDKAERMLDAPNFEDAAKMLTDSGYEDMSQMSVKQIETALSDRRAAVFHELETLIPNTAALDLFRLKYDYHNAKVLVKSEAMHRNDASLLSSSGRVAPETVQKRFQEDRLRDLPGELGSAAEEARNLLARSEKHILFTLGGSGVDFHLFVNQYVGEVALRRNNNDNVVALGKGVCYDLRHVHDSLGIGNGCTAEFLNNQTHFQYTPFVF